MATKAARDVEKLQKLYAHAATEKGTGGMGLGPGGPGGRGPGRRGGPGGRPTGKPSHTKETVARLISYIAAYRARLVVVLLCMLISTLTSVVGGYLLRDVINVVTVKPAHAVTDSAADAATSDSDASDAMTTGINWISFIVEDPSQGVTTEQRVACLGLILGILACIYGVGVVTTYLQNRLMLTVSQNAVEKLRNELFNKLQKLPVRYFDSNTTGELMSRFTNDMDTVETMINNTVTSLVSGTITLISTFVMMVYTNIWLTLITVVFVPLFAGLGSAIAKRSGRYYGAQQVALGAVNGYIEETVTGSRVVKVFNHEDTCVEEFDSLNNDMREKQFKAQFYGGVMGPVMNNTSNISFALTAGVGGVLCVTSGFDVGGLALFCNYSRQFSFPINQISMLMSTILSALAGAERVFTVMDQEPEPDDRPDCVSMDQVSGEVVLDNVSFGYLPGQPVLRHISLYAHAGQKIAFVGSTGAGKTTITNLINRFYDIDEGTITIDGVDIRSYRRDDLRSHIAMVLQDTHLFTGTIMDNIRYGRPDATDEEVIEAAKTASAHSFIMRLSKGYQTVLEGDGANLSQGQRQLLNIARAAISKAPILVLDEATSSVDTRTERHIEHGMDRLMKNRTTFVIAHRLSTVRNADAIMVLEHGEIMERGNHDQLLALGGRYYELYTGGKELD